MVSGKGCDASQAFHFLLSSHQTLRSYWAALHNHFLKAGDEGPYFCCLKLIFCCGGNLVFFMVFCSGRLELNTLEFHIKDLGLYGLQTGLH